MLYGEWDILVVVVVLLPPSQRKLCMNNGLVLELLELAVAVGLACSESACAAPHIPDIAEGFVHL